jgi:glycine cleavage system aminomethyltransferase T
MKAVEKVTGKPAPDLKVFHMTTIMIAGHKVRAVRALRHGMAGQPGLELWSVARARSRESRHPRSWTRIWAAISRSKILIIQHV